MKHSQYIKGLSDAADIAANHAKDDRLAADSATELDDKSTCLAQQERSLAIEKSIRERITQ